MAGIINIETDTSDLERVCKRISKLGPEGKKAMSWTAKDMKSKGRRVVKEHVQKVYNIDDKGFNKGKVRTKGSGTDFTMEFVSPMLSPIHFGLQGNKATRGKGRWKRSKKGGWTWIRGTTNYMLSAEILKGKRRQIGEYHNTQPGKKRGKHTSDSSPTMMLRGKPVPMRRKGTRISHGNGYEREWTWSPKGEVEAFKVMSVSSMVTSGRVAPEMLEDLQKEYVRILEKKLEAVIARL